MERVGERVKRFIKTGARVLVFGGGSLLAACGSTAPLPPSGQGYLEILPGCVTPLDQDGNVSKTPVTSVYVNFRDAIRYRPGVKVEFEDAQTGRRRIPITAKYEAGVPREGWSFIVSGSLPSVGPEDSFTFQPDHTYEIRLFEESWEQQPDVLTNLIADREFRTPPCP